MNARIKIKLIGNNVKRIDMNRNDIMKFAKNEFTRLSKKNLSIPVSLFHL